MADIKYIKHDSIDSTNTYAKMHADEFTHEFTVISTKIQTKGRGRLDRSFMSDNTDGAWFSIAIKPTGYIISHKDALLVPIMAAGAVVQTLFDMYGIKAGIKWPNDILVNKKKVCGILCESRMNAAGATLLVIGIGVNVNNQKLPAGLENRASSMYIETKTVMDTDSIIQNICRNVIDCYDKIKTGETTKIVDKWNEFSLMNDVHITYEKDGTVYKAVSLGIDLDGKLVVRQKDDIIKLDCNEVRMELEGAKNVR